MEALEGAWDQEHPYALNQDDAASMSGLTMLVRHGAYFLQVNQNLAQTCASLPALISTNLAHLSHIRASVPTYFTVDGK